MSTALFDLDDFEETRTEWVPIVIRFDEQPLVRKLKAFDIICRDCGCKTAYSQGGADRDGHYAVCDDCAQLDNCRISVHEITEERRPGEYGRTEVARCSCGWWLWAEHWADEGEWRELTPEQITDLLAGHLRPRHVSRWGKEHEIAEHDRLVEAQARRRAAYLRRTA